MRWNMTDSLSAEAKGWPPPGERQRALARRSWARCGCAGLRSVTLDPGVVAGTRSRAQGAGDRVAAASFEPHVTRRGRRCLPGIRRRRPAQVFYGCEPLGCWGEQPNAFTVSPPLHKRSSGKESNLHVPVSPLSPAPGTLARGRAKVTTL